MRSVIQHLGPYLNTLHLISADYPFPFEDYSADPPLRVGMLTPSILTVGGFRNLTHIGL
jgi:hypothetical protein